MRKLVFVLTALAFTLSLGAVQASADVGKDFSYFFQFQWLRDADGDGIPNCLDDDWERPQNGTGYGQNNGTCLPTNGVYVVTGEDEALKPLTRTGTRRNDDISDGAHKRPRDHLSY